MNDTLRYLRRTFPFCMLLAALLFAPAAWACQDDVTRAAAYLSELKRDAPKAKAKHKARVQAFLSDAEQTLDSARRDCNAADNFAERALASTRVAAARASMASAAALIPSE